MTYESEKLFTRRYRLILVFLAVLALALLGRLLMLTLFERPFLEKQGDARTMRTEPLFAYRGMIKDRNGQTLAVSVPVVSIWINPKQFILSNPNNSKMLKILGVSQNNLKKDIDSHNEKEFLYVKRQVAPNLAAKVMALKIPGVYAQNEYKRYYPQAEVTAPLIGFTNVDNQGQEGIELEFNDWLEGTPGKELVAKDLYGHVVSIKGVTKEAKPGKDLVLSIDSRVQYQAYSELKAAVTDNNAVSASMVVLDIKTGEVLAVANYPSYDPNQHSVKRDSNFKNKALTDLFEPGSTTKPLAVVNALQSGHCKANTQIDTSPGWLILDGKKVEDEHNNGVIDIKTILEVSSNVGISKLTLSLPANSLWQLLNKIGYGSRTASGFPGESAGVLPYHPKWSNFTLATMSFGYGISVTTLQLAQAYATLANHGMHYPVSLLSIDAPTKGEQLISAKAADDVMFMLRSVISEKKGTAKSANIPGYLVTGKTGTVRIVGPNGYEKFHHNAIFVGAVPASNPHYVAAVIVRDPQQGSYLGGIVAAPIFANVMANVLREYNIAPDNPVT